MYNVGFTTNAVTMRRTVAFFLLLIFLSTIPVYAQNNGRIAGGLIRLLRPLISGAVEKASKGKVQDADPFVMAVAYMVQSEPDRASISFLEGLINNGVVEQEAVTSILNGITGVAIGSSLVLTLAGQDEVGKEIAQFAVKIRTNPIFKKWSDAVARGESARIVNGELVIEEEKAVESGQSAQDDTRTAQGNTVEQGYQPTKENEVLPFLNIRHGRPGAKIFVDEKEVATSTYEEYMFNDLPAGKHRITVSDGIYEGSVTVFVNPGRETRTGFDEIALEMAKGRAFLTVDLGIKGLPVYLDERILGTTPLVNKIISAGSHRVEVKSEWNEATGWDINPMAREKVVIKETITVSGAIRPAFNIPEDAEITINGRVSPVQYENMYLLPGAYDVSIKHPTIFPYSRKVTVSAAKVTKLGEGLAFRTGKLKIQPLPANVDILIDGVNITAMGDPENVLDHMVIGEHRVLLLNRYLKEQRPDIRTVQIEEGKTTSLEIETGRVVLNSIPEDSILLLGGESFPLDSRSPREKPASLPLTPGSYEIHLSGEGIQSEKVAVVVKGGEDVLQHLDINYYGSVDLQFSHIVELEISKNGKPIEAHKHIKQMQIELPAGIYVANARRAGDRGWGLTETFEVARSTGSNAVKHFFEVDYSPAHKLDLAHDELAGIEKKLAGRPGKVIAGLSFLGAGVLGTVTATVSYFLGTDALDRYENATLTSDAVSARADAELYGTITTAAAGASAGAVSVGSVLLLSGPSKASLTEQKNKLEQRITTLGAEMARAEARRAQLLSGMGNEE